MAIAEPGTPLWQAVKGFGDPWPPDSEDAAQALGQAWQTAGTNIGQAKQAATQAGQAATAAWQDNAGKAFGELMSSFGDQLDGLTSATGDVSAAGTEYAQTLIAAKNLITSTISANESTYANLGNPLFGAAGQAMQAAFAGAISAYLNGAMLMQATGLAGVQTGGHTTREKPGTGSSVTPPRDGKMGEAKAWANLGKFGQDGFIQTELGRLAGKYELKVGAEASAGFAVNDEGLKAKAGASAGASAAAEGRADIGAVGLMGRVDGFAGAKADAGLTVGRDGISGKAGAFAGVRGGYRGQVDVGGIGIGYGAEGWVGPGAEAKFEFGRGEDGKFHIGGDAGASPVLGGSGHVDLVLDTDKIGRELADVF